MFSLLRRLSLTAKARRQRASTYRPSVEGLEHRCVPTTIALNFDSLPSAQGWTYFTQNSFAETQVFRVGPNANNEPTLFQDTIHVGLPGSDSNRYELSGVLDPLLTDFNLHVRAAVLAEEFGGNHFGFSFFVNYGGSAVNVGIGTDAVQVVDSLAPRTPRNLSTGLDNTGYHDYVLSGTVGPSSTWTLSRDALLLGTGSFINTPGNTLHLGDGSAGANARAEITSYIFTQGLVLPAVQAVTINDGSAQRSMVNNIAVTFTSVVGIDTGAFDVHREGGNSVGLDVVTSVVDGRSVAVISFNGSDILAGSLADGTYTFTIFSTRVHDAVGRELDGDGDGMPGGNRVDTFFRLFGDTNGDGHVDLNDLDAFISTYGKSRGDTGYLWYLDYNGDGTVNLNDWLAFRNRLPPF